MDFNLRTDDLVKFNIKMKTWIIPELKTAWRLDVKLKIVWEINTVHIMLKNSGFQRCKYGGTLNTTYIFQLLLLFSDH